MTATQSLNLYNITLRHFKNEEDAAFIKEIEVVVDNKFDNKKEILATKQDLSETKVDLIKWMVGMWIAQMAAIVFLIIRK